MQSSVLLCFFIVSFINHVVWITSIRVEVDVLLADCRHNVTRAQRTTAGVGWDGEEEGMRFDRRCSRLLALLEVRV